MCTEGGAQPVSAQVTPGQAAHHFLRAGSSLRSACSKFQLHSLELSWVFFLNLFNPQLVDSMDVTPTSEGQMSHECKASGIR